MVLYSHTLSNGMNGSLGTTCDSRHERAGVDTYLRYRGPPRGRGSPDCLVSRAPLMVISDEAGPRGDATVSSFVHSSVRYRVGNLGTGA